MNATPTPPIETQTHQRRRGMVAAARRCGVGYVSFYRAVAWLNGDAERGRRPGARLGAAIRDLYPELITPNTNPTPAQNGKQTW